MKNPVTLFIAVVLLVVTSWVGATTRYVSMYSAGQYTTISAAYSAAVSGDTILIGPGDYSETSLSSNKRLTWLGAGWDQSKITFSGQLTITATSASGSRIEGLRIEGYYYAVNLINNVDSVSICRCVLKCNYLNGKVLLGQAGRIYVEDCILIQNYNDYTVQIPNAASLFRSCIFASGSSSNYACFYSISGTAGTLEIYNCVFLNHLQIFNLTNGSQPVIAVNNIFYDWRTSPTFGTYPSASTFDYNASQTITAPGTETISITSNPFVNYNETNNYEEVVSDLHLVAGSGLIDTGHPNLFDLDQTRSDFGVYGGPHPLVDNGIPAYPWTINLTLNPNLVGQGTDVNATAVGRIGPQY